jgi:hypothetical protein
LSLLNVADSEDHAGHLDRLNQMLEEATKEVPGPDPRSAEANTPAFVVVAKQATRAVELMGEAAALGVHLAVVPKVSEAVRFAESRSVRGALLGRVGPDTIEGALRLRAVTHDADHRRLVAGPESCGRRSGGRDCRPAELGRADGCADRAVGG